MTLHQPSRKDSQNAVGHSNLSVSPSLPPRLSLGGSLRSGGHGLMRCATVGHW